MHFRPGGKRGDKGNKWQAIISVDGKTRISLGCHDEEVTAARAYDLKLTFDYPDLVHIKGLNFRKSSF